MRLVVVRRVADRVTLELPIRWLALEGITAPTPWGWTVHYEPGSMDQYHYHKATDSKSFEHPLDQHCRKTGSDFKDAVAAHQYALDKAEAAAAEIAAWTALEVAEEMAEEMALVGLRFGDVTVTVLAPGRTSNRWSEAHEQAVAATARSVRPRRARASTSKYLEKEVYKGR